MLERELNDALKNINNSKNEMIEMNNQILEMNKNTIVASIEAVQSRISEIDSTPVEEVNESLIDEKEDLLKEKVKLEEELTNIEAEIIKENEEIANYGKDLELYKENKFETVLEVIAHLEEILETEEYKEESKRDSLLKKVDILKDTLTLNELGDFETKKTLSQMRKNFDSISKQLQTKLAKDNKYVYPSCLQLKKYIKQIIAESIPNFDESELNKRSKEFTAFIYMYLSSVHENKEGIKVYYVLKNVYDMEKMSIDEQFKFKNRLVEIFKNKIYK